MDRLRSIMASPIIFDGRNIYDTERMQQFGFQYYAVGRGDQPTGDGSQGARYVGAEKASRI
jgi:hypothetical protein